MDKIIEDTLILLGLSRLEVRFFKSCFILGNPTISQVIKHARMERSTGYLVVQNLIEKKLIFEDYKEYKKRIRTCDPSQILRMISAKQRSIGKKELELKEKLPELQANFTTNNIRPRVQVFEGIKGLLSIWNDILSENKEIFLWTNQEEEKKFFPAYYHQQFIEERVKKQIPIKVLAIKNYRGLELVKTDKELLRNTRLLPKEVNFSSETYIYSNKIAVLDFNEEIVGIIIQSEQVSNAQRAIFVNSWKNCE